MRYFKDKNVNSKFINVGSNPILNVIIIIISIQISLIGKSIYFVNRILEVQIFYLAISLLLIHLFSLGIKL